MPRDTSQGARATFPVVGGRQPADSVFLAGRPQIADRLGLGKAAGSTRRKLLEALSAPLRPEAGVLDGWFLDDSDPWATTSVPSEELRRLATCIRRRRVVEVTIGNDPVVETHLLGLGLQAGAWFLVTGGDPVSVFSIDHLQIPSHHAAQLRSPPEFSLSSRAPMPPGPGLTAGPASGWRSFGDSSKRTVDPSGWALGPAAG